MIEAGAGIIWQAFGDVIPYGSETGRDVANEVYLAMVFVGENKSREKSAQNKREVPSP